MLIVSSLSLFSDGWFQVVHPAPGNANGTLVNGILHHCSLPTAAFPNSDIFSETEYSSDAEFDSFPADRDSAEEISSNVCNDSVRPGIVHRLDKGTSGLLVVAKVIPIFVKNAWEHEIDNQFLYSIIVEIQYTMFKIPGMVIYDYMYSIQHVLWVDGIYFIWQPLLIKSNKMLWFIVLKHCCFTSGLLFFSWRLVIPCHCTWVLLCFKIPFFFFNRRHDEPTTSRLQ